MAKFGFRMEIVTPEEDRRNTAMSLVMGFWPRDRLGKQQKALLCRMYGHSPMAWGSTWENRRVLAGLERRELVEKHGLGLTLASQFWKITPLGEEVAKILNSDERLER